MTPDTWFVVLAFVIAPAVVIRFGCLALVLHERGSR
jgi:hypothetical protein